MFRLKFLSFYNFFLRDQPHWLRDLSETSKWKFTAKTFLANTWFIHFDGLCNYLHSFQKHPAANFFEKKCCFPDQEHVGHYINKFIKTGLEFFIKVFKGHLMRILLLRRHLLLLLLIVAVLVIVVVVEVIVVAVVVAIVLVAVAVVLKSCPGLVDTNWGPWPGSELVNTI